MTRSTTSDPGRIATAISPSSSTRPTPSSVGRTSSFRAHDPDGADVAVTASLTDRVESFARAGGSVVLVPDESDWSSPLLERKRGDGSLWICTFRITEGHGAHPVGTELLNTVLERCLQGNDDP